MRKYEVSPGEILQYFNGEIGNVISVSDVACYGRWIDSAFSGPMSATDFGVLLAVLPLHDSIRKVNPYEEI